MPLSTRMALITITALAAVMAPAVFGSPLAARIEMDGRGAGKVEMPLAGLPGVDADGALAGLMDSASQFRARWRPETGDARPEAAVAEPPPLPEHCELAVVGAGWGGVYAAWRLAVDDGSQLKPEDVCVFEASGRVGGRIMSVHDIPGFEDMTLDIGGYRFNKDDTIVAQLIQERLKIPTICYDFGLEPADCSAYIVRDAYGNNDGYARPMEIMLGQIEAAQVGSQEVFFGKELVGIFSANGNPAPGATRLEFKDGTSVTATRVLLNTPHRALENLDRESVIFANAEPMTRKLLDSVTTTSWNKVYVHYEDAWWNSKLGLMQGAFVEKNGEWANKAPFDGRYHDGPQKCVVGTDGAGDPIYSGLKVQFGNCSGAIETFYAELDTMAPDTGYYQFFQTNLERPMTVISDGDTTEAHRMLIESHEHLMAYHAELFAAAGVDPATIKPPLHAVIGNWAEGATFAPGIGYFPWFNLQRAVVRNPTEDHGVFLANQDWGYKAGWAIGSLTMAEKVLQAEFGLKQPAWLDDEWYQANIMDVP